MKTSGSQNQNDLLKFDERVQADYRTEPRTHRADSGFGKSGLGGFDFENAAASSGQLIPENCRCQNTNSDRTGN